MRLCIVISIVVYSMMACRSAGMFLFRTIKPKLYPFVSAYSGVEEEHRSNETQEQEEHAKWLDPKMWAWIVIILDATYDLPRQKTVYEELCLGVLITRSDVLTTCWCVRNGRISDESTARAANLVVKPKTTLVPRDEMISEVTHVLLHESCSKCNATTSYNNLALLTVQLFQFTYGVTETLPRSFYKTLKEKKSERVRNNIYENCYIVVKDTESPVDNHTRLSPLPMSRRQFTPWDFPSPENDIGTKIVVGRSGVLRSPELRYPGSPLICQNKQTKREMPVGIYMGLVCHDEKIDLTEWKKKCSKLSFRVKYEDGVCRGNAFEIVVRLDSLGEWLEENTFEIIERKIVPYKKSRSYQPKASFWDIFILIRILFFRELFI